MGALDFLFGSKGHNEQVSTLNPQQQQSLSSLLGGLNGQRDQNPDSLIGQSQRSLMDILSNDPMAFKNFERPAMRQFNQEIVPGIGERFSSQFGGQGSSAFRNALLNAGSDLSQKLSEQRSGLQSNARDQIFQQLQQGLGTKAFENQYHEGSEGLVPGLLKSAVGGFAGSGGFQYLLGGGKGEKDIPPDPYAQAPFDQNALNSMGGVQRSPFSLNQHQMPQRQNGTQYFQLPPQQQAPPGSAGSGSSGGSGRSFLNPFVMNNPLSLFSLLSGR